MTDTTVAAVAAALAVPPVTATPTPPKPKRFKLVDEWEWVLAHSWSLRFMFVAALLSSLEVILPLLTSLHGFPMYPLWMGLTTGAAFVARLVAQKREGVDAD